MTSLDATMLVVSSVIGVGIFLTPGTVAELLYAPGDQVNEGAPLLRLESTPA